MNRTEHNPEALLDAAIAEVQNDGIDPQVVEESRRHVWARIAAAAQSEAAAPGPKVDHIRGCADFQALMPDYRAGQLSLARRMLLEDHVHECVACRKAMHPEAQMRPPAKVVQMPQRAVTTRRWAIAAMIAVGVGSSVWFGYDRLGPAPAGNRATLLASDAQVYKLTDGGVTPVAAGAVFADGDRLRTSNGRATMRLMDGSTVEVSDRAELSVSVDRRNTNVYLNRGRIIVQAAKRNRGHLYVSIGDARVAVTGTVFSVNRGLAGSRVSVIEGSVEVQQGGDEHLLKPGDQRVTHSSITKVDITDEIAWSRNFDQHVAMLKQFADMKEKLAAIRMPGLRYSSRLLDSVPEGTSIYISVPNLSRAVADVQRIVADQAKQSPEMRKWLETGMPRFEEFTTKLTTLGEYLGEEITFAFQPCAGFCGIAIAEVHRPGLKEFIQKEAAAAGAAAAFQIVDGSAAATATAHKGLKVAFEGDRVIIGEQAQFITTAAKGGTGFAATPFGQAIGERYKRGTGVLLAVNLERMVGDEIASAEASKRTFAARAGIDKVKYLIAEQRTFDNNRTEYLASVNFDSARSGIASWLAEPGAMGSLQFVSPGAQFATSLVVKKPEQMLDEALKMLGGGANLDKLRADTGVDLKQEVVAALGGEVTFAFDGPMLPTPSWKVILEVNDPVKLQAAIEKIVAAANRELEKHGGTKLSIEVAQQEHRQQQGVSLRSQNLVGHILKTGQPLMPEIHYVFVDGYLLMTSNEALLTRSISDRMSGVSLARSRRFTRLLPRNAQTNFSAMVYQNAGELLSLVAKGGTAVAGANPEQQRRVDEIAGRVEPMLVCVYGESDRIEIASQGSAWDVLMNSAAGSLLGGARQQSQGTRAPREAYR